MLGSFLILDPLTTIKPRFFCERTLIFFHIYVTLLRLSIHNTTKICKPLAPYQFKIHGVISLQDVTSCETDFDPA